MTAIVQWFALPESLTEGEQQTRIYRRVVVSTMIIVTVLFGILAIVQTSLAQRAMVAMGIVDGVGAMGLALSHRGQSRLASGIFLTILISLVSIMALSAGGIRSPGMSLFLVFTLLAALLLGRRAAVVTAAVCAVIAGALAITEVLGILPPQTVRYQPLALLILQLTYLSVMLIVVQMIVGSISKSLTRAERELAERQRADAERERLVIELGERVKELRLLHRAADLLQPEEPFNRELLDSLVREIPTAWMYPECCVARITYGRSEAMTDGWRETPWMQKATFRAAGLDGTIEVAYTEERPKHDEGPFLVEERSLIESLAEMLQAHIERDTAERNRQLMETSLRQAQKMDALGTLAGGIAHDFNNILTAIGGYAELGMAATDDPELQHSFSEIRAGYTRARDLVKRILIFSRRQESAQGVIRLEPVTTEAVQLLKASLPPRIEIRTKFAPDAPNIRGDASQMHQIIMNLGTNAAYAMRADPGVLDIEIDSVEIADAESIRLGLPAGKYARLLVRDTGTGMGPDVIERVFEPFFTTKGLEGTGLGLAVVHGIVRDHRGAIDVESERGLGTTFRVYFPAVTAQGIVEVEPEAVRGKGQRIMYVDDDVRIVAFMSRVLTRLGYKDESYSDPVKALEAFGRSPSSYAAVVTDMAMPVMNGVELAAAVHAIRPDVPVALTSGYGADDSELIRTQNIAAVIQKPASIAEISRVLGELVGKA
jgi:signal transduction histidine kinase